MEFDDLSHRVIGCAIEVHRALGPEVLESAYEQCLAHELARNNIRFQLQHPQPVEYKGIHLDCGYRIDLLVDRVLILELKRVYKPTAIHEARLWTDMKLADVKTGLLVNFNVTKLKDGIKRFVVSSSCSSRPSWFYLSPGDWCRVECRSMPFTRRPRVRAIGLV